MDLFGTHSKKRVIAYSLLGMLFGLVSYMSLSLAGNVMLYPLLLCFLYAKAGLIPVLVSIAGFSASFTTFAGLGGTLLGFVVLVLPALLTISAIAGKLPYFRQFKISICAFGGSVIAMLLIAAALSGGNLVDSILEIVRQSVEALPASMQDAMLTLLYPNLTSVNATSIPVLDVLIRRQYMNDFFLTLREDLLDQMLPMLLKSSLTSAFLASYLTPRSLYLKGRLPQECFVPLSQWGLSATHTVGILLTTLAAYLIDTFAGTGSVTTFLTMFTIMECAFAVQGMAAWDRMMCAAKASYRRKLVAVGGIAIIAPTFLSAIGMCSALFGRRGLLMKITRKNNNNN